MAQLVSIATTAKMLNRQAVQYATDIRSQFRQGLEFETELGLSWRSTDKVWTAPNIKVNSALQAYQPRFTPKNTESFDAVDNMLRPVKVDLEFNEEQLEKFQDSWAQNWFEAGKPPMEWSYPKYIMSKEILPVIQEDLNNAAWNGVYVAPTPGIAGTALDSVDGYNIALVNAINAGKLVPVASGSYSASDIRAKLEAWVMALPVVVRKKSGTILMSDTWMRKFYYGMRADFATATWQQLNASEGGLKVDGTNMTIRGVAGMEGSNRWIFLPANDDNMILGTRKGFSRDPQFFFDADLYTLRAKAVFYRFFGFEYWDTLYVNDQA